MSTVQDLRKKYHKHVAPLDLELLFSFVLKKPREFVLAHPEHTIPALHLVQIEKLIKRRVKGEPIAYIMGKKEFYGLEFKVNKNTLIPRPETELLIDLVLEEIRTSVRRQLRTINVVDVGTGSGNIIISLSYSLPAGQAGLKHETHNNLCFYGSDISFGALAVAKENSKRHKVDKKIKFLQGNLLEPILEHKKYFTHPATHIILANLPYLSSSIYASAPKDVKDYEPRSALYSAKGGLKHYIELLQQIARLFEKHSPPHILCYMEISPEQKISLQKIIRQLLPLAKITLFKDLSGRWRVIKMEI